MIDDAVVNASKAKQSTEDKAPPSIAELNKAAGKKFLDENAKKEGVKTTASGLQYKIIKQGSGEKPKDTDFVETNYRGTTIDGKEFDSSAKNGGPVSFPVNGVVKGWSEALKLMPVGSRWQLFVPSELAYGDDGAGNDIAPGATLIFDVELLGIKVDRHEITLELFQELYRAELSLNDEYNALRATLTKRQKAILRDEELAWLRKRELLKGNPNTCLEFTLERVKELRRRHTGHD